jgi:hypothetical protein
LTTLSSEDRRFLEDKLDKILDEAWTKLNAALEGINGEGEDSKRSVWLAAEAVEYASLVFNLTYGLDDLDPVVKIKRGEDPLVLLKDSYKSLRSARELREKSATDAYVSLRVAADKLKAAYVKKAYRIRKGTG